ncbi:MAG: metallophosphoesterase [Clostridia bacterium]|nr:metallophosphoesterase [Clostridia bacterium]
MKIIKLLVILALSLLLIFTVVSCGKNTDTDTNSDTDNTSRDSENVDNSVNSDTDSDISSDTDSDTTDDEDVIIEPWQSNASADVIEQVESLLESKHKLEYNKDGSFRVMIIADAHMNINGNSTDVERLKIRIKTMVDKIQPNLIIFTGDNTISSIYESTLRKNINALVSYIEEKQIPWCHVYGNHDHENALDHAKQQAIYESYEYCISKDVTELSGTGTYVHGVYNRDGSLGSLIWLLDSGAYADQSQYSSYYDFIKQDQIDWYKETSLLIKEYNNGNHVNGIMAFHIPLVENREAYKNINNLDIVYEITGGVNENIHPSEVDTNLLETIFDLGNIKAIVTGHDHINDYTINYKGVKLASSPNLSDLTYYTESIQGSRVLDLNASTITNVPTYVEYLIERPDPNKYGAFQSGTVLEDFEGGVKDIVISGWDDKELNANVLAEPAKTVGADGTKGLYISTSVGGSEGSFEFVVDLDTYGKVGNNKYIIVWMDFTNVEIRKGCIGFTSLAGTEFPYRTDDNNGSYSKFYYLADGATEWETLSHGFDGCFGAGDGGASSVKGKRGYFAFEIDDLIQDRILPNADTLITGFYFYGSVQNASYINTGFFIDNVIIVEDYKTATLSK